MAAYTAEGGDDGLMPFFGVVSHIRNFWANESGNKHWRYFCSGLCLFTSLLAMSFFVSRVQLLLLHHLLEFAMLSSTLSEINFVIS